MGFQFYYWNEIKQLHSSRDKIKLSEHKYKVNAH